MGVSDIFDRLRVARVRRSVVHPTGPRKATARFGMDCAGWSGSRYLEKDGVGCGAITTRHVCPDAKRRWDDQCELKPKEGACTDADAMDAWSTSRTPYSLRAMVAMVSKATAVLVTAPAVGVHLHVDGEQ